MSVESREGARVTASILFRWVESTATRDGSVKYDGKVFEVKPPFTMSSIFFLIYLLGEWELKAPSTEAGLEGDTGLVMPVGIKLASDLTFI